MPEPVGTTETPEPPAEPVEPERPGFFKRYNPLKQVGTAAAVVGLVGGIVGLLFVFKPGWKPTPAPDVGTLKITESRVRQPVTFGRYLQRVRLPPGDLTKAFLGRSGLLVEFDYEAHGFRGKRLPIQWELVDARTNDRVAGDDAVGITPSTNDEAATWFVWVQKPRHAKKYYVTVTIYQPRKGDVEIPLADFDTPKFSGSGAG